MKNNNFTFVRLILSFMVLLFHLSVLTQLKEFYFLKEYISANYAIKGFFVISGYLVYQSFINSSSSKEYFIKRFKRLYPAYIVGLLLSFIIAISITSLNIYEFLKSVDLYRFFLFNLFFLNFVQPTLPGVFENNYISAINGSLWTIKIEVIFYALIPYLIMLLKKNNKFLILVIVYLVSISWVYYFQNLYDGVYINNLYKQLPGQLIYFCLGIFLSMNKKYIKYCFVIFTSSLLVSLLFQSKIVNYLVEPIFISSSIIYFSLYTKKISLNKVGDLSYGIYLYHFPFIQLIFSVSFFNLNPWLGFLCVIFITVFASFISWHFVEKRYLFNRQKII